MLWKKHYIGDRAFFRKTGVNPDTGQAWSPAEKDASIRLWLPSVAVILEAKDESAVADLAWFEARWRLVQDALTQLEARLRAFYTQYNNGAKLADVGQIAREHVGNEKALNQKLRAAYQTDLGLVTTAGPMQGRWEVKLSAGQELSVRPANLPQIGDLLDAPIDAKSPILIGDLLDASDLLDAPEGKEWQKIAGRWHLVPAETKKLPSLLYHATNLKAALLIQDGGFRVDLSGSNAGARLGPGVYCTATLQKAMQYCKGPHGGIVFELHVDLGRCKTLQINDPMMTTWQQNGYDSAWAPPDAGGSDLEENCIKNAGRVSIKQAIAGHTFKLQEAGYKIAAGRIVQDPSLMQPANTSMQIFVKLASGDLHSGPWRSTIALDVQPNTTLVEVQDMILKHRTVICHKRLCTALVLDHTSHSILSVFSCAYERL